MNVPYCLRRARQLHGDRLAIDHEGQQLTYRQLYDRVVDSAHKLRAAGVQAGDAVATVANAGGYSTTAIKAVGGQPVYVDISAETYTLDPGAAAIAVKRTPVKALIVTHLYGSLADMVPVLELANQHRIPVIEDCAQAHGARREGRLAGNWGTLATFSFYPTKNLGTIGDGGAIVTSQDDLAVRVRELRQYGWSKKYHVTRAGGRNSRLDEVQAAVLRSLLPRLDSWNEQRRAIALQYANLLKHLPLDLPTIHGEDHVAHLYVVRTPHRDRLRELLTMAGIGTDVHYPFPDHLQPGFEIAPIVLPNTEAASRSLLTLPCFPEMTARDVQLVADAIIEAHEREGWGAK